MIRHFVAFQYKEGTDLEARYRFLQAEYPKLSVLVPGIREIRVHKNVIERPFNMDIMVEMVVEDERVLAAYLQHTLHRQIQAINDPDVKLRNSFDYKM